MRSPIVAPSPIATNGPTETSAPRLRIGRDRRQRVHARRADATPARRAPTARANARYGSRARSIAHGAAGASSLRMTAEAASCASAFSYFGLARNVTSPGCASWMPATRVMSRSPSPSSRQSNRVGQFAVSFTG